MILDVTPEFASKVSSEDWYDLLKDINKNNHYFLRNPEVQRIIKAKLKAEKCEILERPLKVLTDRKGFNPSKELQKFLTILKVDASFEVEHLKTIVATPGYLICENRNYEWDVYKHFCSLYSKDRKGTGNPNKYYNIIGVLMCAMEKGRIIATNNGGDGQLKPTYEYLEKNTWKGNPYLKLKCCFLFDRDTDSENSFSKNHKDLFEFLNNGKNHTNTSHADIYILTQNEYIWHMWYKRAIENYISDRCYTDNYVDLSNLHAAIKDGQVTRDYYNICEKKCKGYEKKNLGSIAKLMDYQWLEENTKRFQCGEDNLSEIQLFLLKLVKII